MPPVDAPAFVQGPAGTEGGPESAVRGLRPRLPSALQNNPPPSVAAWRWVWIQKIQSKAIRSRQRPPEAGVIRRCPGSVHSFRSDAGSGADAGSDS